MYSIVLGLVYLTGQLIYNWITFCRTEPELKHVGPLLSLDPTRVAHLIIMGP